MTRAGGSAFAVLIVVKRCRLCISREDLSTEGSGDGGEGKAGESNVAMRPGDSDSPSMFTRTAH